MPATQWTPALPLIGRLLKRPQQFEFFQAMRLLEVWTGSGPSQPNAVHRPIRFRNRVSMKFPGSDIESIDIEGEGIEKRRYAYMPGTEIGVTPSFMGLLGSSGTLPYEYTEKIGEAPSSQTKPLREFFDILSQRGYGLFCEAWACARVTYRFDEHGRNAMLPSQLAIAGTGRLDSETPTVRDEVRAYYGAAMRLRAVSSTILGQVLSDYFDVPIEVQPCVGGWTDLEPREQFRLGVSNCTLGVDAVLGSRTYQPDHRMRLRIGPLTMEQYSTFWPGAAGTKALAEVLACFPVSHLKFQVNPVLRAQDAQPCVLTSSDSGGGFRLGLNTFLGDPGGRDRDDLCFDLPDLEAIRQEE